MDELIYASATALAQSIRSKEVSSEEIVNAYGVARPWRDDVALAVAQRIETALGGWQCLPI